MDLKLRVYKSHNNPLNYFGSFVLLGTLVAFFGFHSLAGERGLLVLDNLDRKIASAQEHLYLLEKKNAEIEARIVLIGSDLIDKDLLEEMVRRELGLFAENDILVLTNKN